MTYDGSGLLWDNPAWANFLNLDNTGGGGGCVDQKNDKNLQDSNNLNSQTASENEVVVVVEDENKNLSNDLDGRKNKNRKGKGGKGKGIVINEGKGGGGGSEGSSDHEIHIWTERERRKKMRTMFSNLHQLLPQLPAKADKSTIVDEAVNYIKTLQNTLQNLQKQKLERLHGISPSKLAMVTREAYIADQVSSNTNNYMSILSSANASTSSNIFQFSPPFQSWKSKNLILNVSGADAQFCVCSSKKPGLLTSICFVLEKYKLEVVSAQVSSDNCKLMYMIHTHASCLDFLEIVPVEEIYKQAAGEMIFFINSE